MKKIIVVFVLLCALCSVTAGAQEQAETEVRDSSLGFNVLGVVAGLILGSVDIAVEYQRSFSPHLALILMPEVNGTTFWASVLISSSPWAMRGRG